MVFPPNYFLQLTHILFHDSNQFTNYQSYHCFSWQLTPTENPGHCCPLYFSLLGNWVEGNGITASAISWIHVYLSFEQKIFPDQTHGQVRVYQQYMLALVWVEKCNVVRLHTIKFLIKRETLEFAVFLGCTVTQLKNNWKTIQWINSRNYNVTGDK